MNKQKRTFVILAIVLAACLAGYLGLLNYNKYKSDDDSESESDSVEALSLDSSDVKSLSFLIDTSGVYLQPYKVRWHIR